MTDSTEKTAGSGKPRAKAAKAEDPPPLSVVGEFDPGGQFVENSYGDRVHRALDGRTHIDDLLQAADFTGFELFFCEFTQRVLVRRRDMEEGVRPDEIVPMSESILTTIWSEIIRCCIVPRGAPKGMGAKGKSKEAKGFEPAEFNMQVFRALAKSFEEEVQSRFSVHSKRVVNTARILLDEFAPLEDCTEEDGAFVESWFLEEWGAKAVGGTGREVVRHLSIRLGANIMHRIHHPGTALKMWPMIVGPANLGKTSFVRHLLPLSMRQFHAHNLSLQKEDDRITRKLAGKLLVELPELAQAKGAEVERLKAVLDLGTKEAVVLYRNEEGEFRATCAMVGTANPDNTILPANSDRALMLRLPMLEITASPWGAERSVEEQMRGDGEALLRRLWRGWRWHYENGFDPTIPPPGHLCDAIVRQSSEHVYVDTGPTEFLEVVVDLARRKVAANDHASAGFGTAAEALGDSMEEIARRGVLASDLEAFVQNTRRGASVGSRSVQSIGRALQKDESWIKTDPSTKARRWTHPAIAMMFPRDMDPDGLIAGACEIHAGEEAVRRATATGEEHDPAAVRARARQEFRDSLARDRDGDLADFMGDDG